MEYSFGILLITDMNKKNANITVSKDDLLSKNIFGSVRLYLKGGGDN